MTKLTITIDLGPHWSESCSAELGLDQPQSDWVALDFETATASRASPCAIGLAHVCGMKVVAVERVLTQPPGNEYDGFNLMIHGIEPEMTADSPTFAEIWPRIHDRLAGKPLVAHNASFDFSVLRHSLDAAGMDYPEPQLLLHSRIRATTLARPAELRSRVGGRSLRLRVQSS